MNLIAALAAGLVGSAAMHYIAPPLVFAQDQTPVAKEIRAQSFALIDQSSIVVGTFASEPLPGFQQRGSSLKGPSRIVLRDQNGRVIWTPDTITRVLPLSMR